MIRNNISMTVKTLKAMKDNPSKDTIDFNSPIQRKSGMWDAKRKSLLIHSILQSGIYSVPTVYFRKDMIGNKQYQYSVIDGIQRITTVFDFIDNRFPLEKVPPVILDGASYEVSGRYFSDLEQDCQQEIIRFKMRIEAFEPEAGDSEEYVNNTIEEVFSRLNSAVPLTSAQLCKAKAGTSVAVLLNKLLTSKFFTESASFTKAQMKTSDDQRCLLQAMMLLDTNYVPGFELKDFSETSIMEYSESIKGNYSNKQQDILVSSTQYLADAFPEKNKLIRKISVPMLMYLADSAMDMGIRPQFFREWWNYFTEEDPMYDDYKLFCSSGSTKLPMIKGRLAVMAKSLCAYHEVDIPEEMKDMVAEVDEKLAAMKAENSLADEAAGNDEPATTDVTENVVALEAEPVNPADEEQITGETTDNVACPDEALEQPVHSVEGEEASEVTTDEDAAENDEAAAYVDESSEAAAYADEASETAAYVDEASTAQEDTEPA